MRIAKFTGTRFTNVSGFGNLSICQASVPEKAAPARFTSNAIPIVIVGPSNFVSVKRCVRFRISRVRLVQETDSDASPWKSPVKSSDTRQWTPDISRPAAMLCAAYSARHRQSVADPCAVLPSFSGTTQNLHTDSVQS
jgi:hypothetical protein